MSEDQGQQKNRRRGFLPWLIVILLIAGYCVWFVNSGLPPDMRGPVWDEAHDDIKNAVANYAADHNSAFPILSGTYTNANCSNCSVINISALLHANGGILYDHPDSLNMSASGNDNCGGNTSLGCSNEGSYIWLVDTNGNVFSYCAGAECTTNNSGYQDVWP